MYVYIRIYIYYTVVLVPSDLYVLTTDKSISCVLYIISALP